MTVVMRAEGEIAGLSLPCLEIHRGELVGLILPAYWEGEVSLAQYLTGAEYCDRVWVAGDSAAVLPRSGEELTVKESANFFGANDRQIADLCRELKLDESAQRSEVKDTPLRFLDFKCVAIHEAVFTVVSTDGLDLINLQSFFDLVRSEGQSMGVLNLMHPVDCKGEDPRLASHDRIIDLSN